MQEDVEELCVPPLVLSALARLCQAIANDDVMYRHYMTLARKLQGKTHGPLSDVIEAMRRG